MKQHSEKLLTLVVPVYNMEKYISRCLETVTDKSIPDTLEVIVVNDGSKDNSLEIIQTFRDLRPEIIQIVDKENGHYGSCVNAGLKLATGKYFRMLDADDWVNTAALASLLENLKTCDADLVITLRTEYKVGKDGQANIETFPFNTIEYGKAYDIQSFDITAHAKRREFNMHSMTYKTEILRQIGLKHIEGICYTDLQYCFLPIDRIKDFIVYDLYLYNYFIGRDEQSTSVTSLARNLPHINKVLRCMFDYLRTCKPVNEITHKNQHYFLLEAVEIYVVSLRMQSHVSEEDYPDILSVLDDIQSSDIQSRIFNKIYFTPWKRLKTRWALNMTVFIYRLVHYRKLKKKGV
ncbi:glycosyltransferase family 2 protein [Phocaeicola sp.]